MLRQLTLASLLGAALAAGGCAEYHHYYKVTEPISGKIYYTDHLVGHMGGAVSLTDRATGDKVTLQNSDLKRITRDEYNRAPK